jgi:hypothetical protein
VDAHDIRPARARRAALRAGARGSILRRARPPRRSGGSSVPRLVPRPLARALGLGPCLALLGCFTVGRAFPVAPVSRIEIGATTQRELLETFGEPWRTGLEDGQETWTWGQYRYAAFGTTRTRDLVVRFDDRDVVTSYSFSSSFPEDRRR